MKNLINILDVLEHNTQRNDGIYNLSQRIVTLLLKDSLNVTEFTLLGNLTVELKGLLTHYPTEVQNSLKTILKEDLSMGEVKRDNYHKLFFNVNKVWKKKEEETF